MTSSFVASLAIVTASLYLLQRVECQNRGNTLRLQAVEERQNYGKPQNQLNQFVDGRQATNDVIRWCTVAKKELTKCNEWSKAIQTAVSHGYVASRYFEFNLECVLANDKDQCMNMIASQRADLVTLDSGEVFIGGRHHSLIPIMTERYGPNRESGYYSVAVVKRESSNYIKQPSDLRGKRACFSGVGHMGGWVLPLSRLLEDKVIEVVDCNNMVKTVVSFFNGTCAPNALIDKHNPTGDNPHAVCSLCANTKCSGSDHFANYDGALTCLAMRGDVAWLKHTTVDQMTRLPPNSRDRSKQIFSKTEFELLCPQGGRMPIDSFSSCNWGFVPSHAVVTLSSTLPDMRMRIQKFLRNSATTFGGNYNPYYVGTSPPRQWERNSSFYSGFDNNYNPQSSRGFNQQQNYNFTLFGDSTGRRSSDSINLLFSDETTALMDIDETKQTFSGFLGQFVDNFERLKMCPVESATLCVISEPELEKCNRMRTAFRAQMLKPELVCVQSHSTVGCMNMIKESKADLVVLDAGDVYKAGQRFDLIPIVSEQYNVAKNDTGYYVVAVARQSDKDTDLLYLKGKRSCHTGYGLAAGWIIPLSFLLSNGRMRSYGCDSARAASEFFQKSCAPGILSREYVTDTWAYGNLCDLCHGESFRFCARDSVEPFFGHTGAMRCLVEGGGQIAFVKHTTILENTAGRNPSWWSRNIIPDDFELLCRDGTRATYNDYKKCNLGVVAGNAIVTPRWKSESHKQAYINLFLLAQQFYGSKFSEDFTLKMFVSTGNYHDLIFQDSTQQLDAVPKEKRDYRAYLGHDFLKAMKIVDCTASASSMASSFLVIFVTFSLHLYDMYNV